MSLLQSIVGKLTNRRTARRQSDGERYAALVRGAAGGKEPPVEELDELLDRLGKEPTAFEADVNRLLARAAMRERFKLVNSTLKEQSQLKVEQEQDDAALARLTTEHQMRYNVRADRLRSLERIEADAEEAGRELEKTADEGLHQRRAEVGRQAAKLHERRKELAGKLENSQQTLQAIENARANPYREKGITPEAELNAHRRMVAELPTAIAALDREIQANDKAGEAIRLELLK